jgi:multiple sugar transport system permease protein
MTETPATEILSRPVAKPKLKPWSVIGKSGAYIILLFGLFVTLLPFIYITVASFKPPAELRERPPTFFPKQWTTEHYATIFNDDSIPLARNVSNSLTVSLARVLITLFTSSFAGYIFAKYRFRGKNIAFGLILIQVMIPFQVIMIPNYLITVRLGLIDTLWALIIPFMIDAFGIFMMKQFIENMPGELIDAARIDGANEFGIYSRVVLPQMGPPLASLGVFTFMATWNDYLWPLIVLTSPEKRTVPLLLVWYNTQHTANQGLVLAASILVLLPIFFIYIFVQRWVVDQAASSSFR